MRERFAGKDAILSGPAGGIVGAARSAERGGLRQIIGFDMGGTSTDVSHYAGEFERNAETVIAGVRCARRCWRSTPSRRAAARSAASTARGIASARNPPAPIRVRPAIAAAGR